VKAPYLDINKCVFLKCLDMFRVPLYPIPWSEVVSVQKPSCRKESLKVNVNKKDTNIAFRNFQTSGNICTYVISGLLFLHVTILPGFP
jgi:hypothetical protein